MRLIDADELREKIVARVNRGESELDRGFTLGIGAALDLLNVAPTICPPDLIYQRATGKTGLPFIETEGGNK